jgi:acyl-CoA synthetase (AMP-forming)/AMP-acid ligase II
MPPGLIHVGLERAADRSPDRVALLAGDDGWTFQNLESGANAFARHLASRGVTAHGRVAVMTTNRPEFVVAVEAISKLGAAAVLLNPAWKALEVDHALRLTSPRHAVADGPAAALLAEQLGERRVSDVDVLSPAAVASSYSTSRFRPGAVDASGDALLVFSSGTTGLPKSVRHTHHSLGWAIRHWRLALGLGPADRFQVATPPSHILGLLNLLTALDAGATVRLHRRFDLEEVLYRIAAERMTLEMAVAPIALALANHPDLERYDLSSLRYIMWGATPVTPSVAETVTRRTGVRWLPAYGASEVPVIAANPVAEPAAWRLDSAGLPAPGVTLRTTELDSGEVLAPGATGAIEVRSPSVMAGYLPDEANAEAFVDGWYRTGDVGWLEPKGWVHLTDRSKEMIKVSGFQVAPAEIEAVLLGHAGVVDCAVFGVPDERAGEVPVAAVRLDPGRAVASEDLKRLVADALASYKRLHHVVVVEDIPRLPSGKVLRRLLRDRWVSPGCDPVGPA